MAFSLTYHKIIDGGLKHTYSTQYGHDKFKSPTDHFGLLQLQRMKESQQLKTQIIQLKSLHKKDEAENWQMLRQLPPGPSYRFLSQKEVDEIVERVRKPTVASQGIERDSEIRCMTARRNSSPRFTGTRPTLSARLPAINSRLSNPTHVTRIRAERDISTIIKSINGSIESDSIVVAQHKNKEYTSDAKC